MWLFMLGKGNYMRNWNLRLKVFILNVNLIMQVCCLQKILSLFITVFELLIIFKKKYFLILIFKRHQFAALVNVMFYSHTVEHHINYTHNVLSVFTLTPLVNFFHRFQLNVLYFLDPGEFLYQFIPSFLISISISIILLSLPLLSLPLLSHFP